MFDVIGLGTSFVDNFLDVDEKLLQELGVAPEEDKLIDHKEITQKILSSFPILAKSAGGSSGNTLAVLSHLGSKVAYYGVTGTDTEATFWETHNAKIDMSYAIREGHISQCGCLLTHQRTKRTFVSQVNEKDNIFFDVVERKKLNNAHYIHLSPFFKHLDVTSKKLLPLFEKINRPKISFAPSYVYAVLGLEVLSPLIKKSHIIFLNQHEIKLLTGKEKEEGSNMLLTMGPEIIVCTLAEKGSLVATKEKHFYTDRFPAEKIVDTTGAGDAFAAGFLYGIINQKSLEWSADFANQIAAKSISDFGLHWVRDISLPKV